MLEIHFTLEFNSRTNQCFPHGKEWAYFDSTPIKIDYGNNAISHLYDAGNKRLCILGHPILNDKINCQEFSRIFLSKDRGEDFFRKINGEFLLIEVNEEDHTIRIINSRFASPIFWYVAQDNFFLGSTSYYQLCLRLKELDQFQLKPETFYEFLNYRRVFGEKTYDKDSLYLKPAHILTFSKNNVDLKAYWTINYEKSKNGLKDNVERLANAISTSIKRKSSDNKRYGLFLSGGMDTRTILANFTETPPHCFTLTYSKNSREYQVAKKLAEWKGAEHTWIKIPTGHDRKLFDDCVELTGAMHMTPTLLMGHKDVVQKYIDVLFAGYGFDYFFQGMYVPAKNYNLFGRKLRYKRIYTIRGDIAEYFIKNISYYTKGFPLTKLLKKNKVNEMHDYIRGVIAGIVSQAKNVSGSVFDIWEYINFSNLSRHYTYGGHLQLMTLAEYRTISYDNDIYDIYLELPVEQRFEARILLGVLKKVNPKFYNYISANHGYPIKYTSAYMSFLEVLRFLKRKILMREIAIENTPETFRRTWLPIEIVLRNEMMDFVASLKDSEYLESLGIFDMDSIRSNVDLWMKNQIEGDQMFLVLLTIDRFIKKINQHRS